MCQRRGIDRYTVACEDARRQILLVGKLDLFMEQFWWITDMKGGENRSNERGYESSNIPLKTACPSCSGIWRSGSVGMWHFDQDHPQGSIPTGNGQKQG